MVSLAVAEEIIKPNRLVEANSPPILAKSVLSPQSIPIPRTPKECRDQAKRLAYSVVSGFIEHDQGHFQKCAENFFDVLLLLFPETGPFRARKGAELYVTALFKHDEIENRPGQNAGRIIEDPLWDEVKEILLEFARTLGIPDSYSEETTNFWRCHGARDNRYVNYLLESDAILTSTILGNRYWSKILGSLYLACVECHDKHDSIGLEAGLQFATKYYEILLRAKMTSPGRQALGPPLIRT